VGQQLYPRHGRGEPLWCGAAAVRLLRRVGAAGSRALQPVSAPPRGDALGGVLSHLLGQKRGASGGAACAAPSSPSAPSTRRHGVPPCFPSRFPPGIQTGFPSGLSSGLPPLFPRRQRRLWQRRFRRRQPRQTISEKESRPKRPALFFCFTLPCGGRGRRPPSAPACVRPRRPACPRR